MDNHPIPQNVTGFEFKLIGDMTLRQFAYLATFSILAYLMFLSPIYFLIKWPFVVIFAFLGIALAFIPVSGRPIDRMAFNFLRAVFSENQYVFRKTVVSTITKAGTPQIETKEGKVETSSQLKTSPLSPPQTIQNQPFAQVNIPISSPPPTVPQIPVDTKMQAQSLPKEEKEKVKTEPQKPEEEVSQIPNVLEQPKPAATLKTKTVPPPFAKIASPTPPLSPNLIAGIVRDKKGDVLPGIIVEIKDKMGLAQRGFKTNKLGQFQAATPLQNGDYTIELEDPLHRYIFEAISLKLSGENVLPLEIKPHDEREELRKSLFDQYKNG